MGAHSKISTFRLMVLGDWIFMFILIIHSDRTLHTKQIDIALDATAWIIRHVKPTIVEKLHALTCVEPPDYCMSATLANTYTYK